MKEGKGIEIKLNGDRYEGEWINDKRNGKGVHIDKYGNRYEGEWKDGNIK